jgi:SAM-dependent methyltransferase
VPADYFVDLYKRETDPWHFRTSPYEQRKYETTLASLPRTLYENGLEIACSIGVFTNMLAHRCRRLLAVDVSPDALARAAYLCEAHKHVRFERRVMPRDYPHGMFDLTTVCEMGFYLSHDDLLALRENVVRHCAPNAHVILVHWTPPVNGHASTTEQVHEAFIESANLRHLLGFSRETYRLDLLERC